MPQENNKFLSGIEDLAKSVRSYVPTGLFELKDTPTGYLGHSGDYLIVNDGESGIHFTGIEKIAQDLTDYGFGGVGGEKVIPREFDILPTPSNFEGEVVRMGCDLYVSCNGQWQKILKEGDDVALPANSSYPGCVSTLSESILYDQYKDQFIEDITEDVFERELLGLPTLPTHEVCLYTADPRNVVKIEETDAKWGLFYGDQTVNITGVPHSSDVSFSKWTSSVSNVLGDENSAGTTLLVNDSMDVVAYFKGLISSDTIDLDPTIAYYNKLAYANGILVLSHYSPGVRVYNLLEDGSTDLIFSNDQGSNYGISVALNESGDKLAVADYAQNAQRVYLYEKQTDNTFLLKNSFGSGLAAFGTDLKWIGNKIYVSTYQWYQIFEYDVQSDYSVIQTRMLYHNPDNISRPNSTNSSYIFGNKFDVYNNDFMIAFSRHRIHFAYLENDEWVININEDIEPSKDVDHSLTNETITFSTIGTAFGAIAIKDRNTIYAGVYNCTVNGLVNAGALFRFSKISNKWLHTQTVVSDNPITDGRFGSDLEFRNKQLFVLEQTSSNPKINIFDMS